MNVNHSTPLRDADSAEPAWLEVVRRNVSSLRFGVVQIVVHESQVVQIERTEKVRLDQPARGNSGPTTGGKNQQLNQLTA